MVDFVGLLVGVCIAMIGAGRDCLPPRACAGMDCWVYVLAVEKFGVVVGGGAVGEGVGVAAAGACTAADRIEVGVVVLMNLFVMDAQSVDLENIGI